MPTIRNSQGQEFDVSDVDAVNMRAADPSLTIVGDVAISPDEAGKAPVSMAGNVVASQAGKAPATAAEQSAFAHGEYLKGKTSTLDAAIRGAASTATFGGSDVLPDSETLEADTLHHNPARIGGMIAGAFLPGAGEAGIEKLLGDATAVEHIGGALSSKFLYAGELGGEAGSAARAAERGLAKAGEGLEAAKSISAVPEDLSSLDKAGLRSARESELANIEQSRVLQRQAIADDIALFRSQLKNDDKIFLATKGIKETALPEGVEGLKIQEIGRTSLEADRSLDRLLRNPIKLAKAPERAMDALQQQENAFLELQKREPTLREMFAEDTSGDRAAALDAVPDALERNRELQARIQSVIAKPASERLSAITAAEDAIATPAKKSLIEDMLGGTIMGHVAGALSGLPIIGPVLGAKAGRLVTDLVFGRMGKVLGAGAERSKAAIGRMFEAASRSPVLPMAASQVLSGARFAPSAAVATKAPAGKQSLSDLYKARSAEIRSQTAYDATGTPKMKPEARQAVADRLAPIRAYAPLLADQLETMAARKIEFLSAKLPRKPDLPVAPGSKDLWQPSDMEMRQFARYVNAVENPHGVEERLAEGTISPEDAEAYKAVYPERHQALTQQILGETPKRGKTVAYQKRIAMSIFTGTATDPSLDPRVLSILQGQFAGEDGSEGGNQAPTPKPQFGSVKADIGTASQQREGLMR